MSDNLDHAAIRAAAAALRRPLMPENGGLQRLAWDLAGYVDALLDNIAELEAHPPMLADPGAEQRGYDKAVANLRDRELYDRMLPTVAPMAPWAVHLNTAGYLVAVKETTE